MKLEGWDFIDHMIEDCSDIIDALRTTPDKQSFIDNRIIQKAVTYSILNLGELMKSFSESERNAYPEIPWRSIIGFRDRAAHGYHTLNLNIVWEIAQDIIAPLLEILNQLKAEMESE